MKHYTIKAEFTEFPLLEMKSPLSDAVIVPTVKGTLFLKYGRHVYYFYNFEKQKCICVDIKHRHIIMPGLALFIRALKKPNTILTKIKMFFEKFHYGFSFMEQIMLMTVPHAVTSIGNGRFIINLWSYFGYLLVDCNTKSVEYIRDDEPDEDGVFGSQQWYRHDADELFYMKYSLPESFEKMGDPTRPVSFSIFKKNLTDNAVSKIWSGPLTDYMHDIMIDKTGRYCVSCELGMFRGKDGNTIPSKVLIVDMKNSRHWIISCFIVAAHAQFDPEDPDVIYFSNHNFRFIATSLIALLWNATYSLKFTGPAAVYKYRLTEDGPVELGVFTDNEMFRLTNFHVFMHKGKKILAAMGFPNFIYIADADTMKYIKKLEVKNKGTSKCYVGTISPSSDGEYLYVQTTLSFQVIKVEDGEIIYYQPFWFNHSAANHMQTVHDTNW